LNAAYNCLSKPKERLFLLLELERGRKPEQVENIPPDLMNLFLKISQLCKQADAFLTEQAGVSSPVLKVQFFERAQELIEMLTAAQREINSRQDNLNAELKDLNANWEQFQNATPSARETILQRLEQLYRLFGYFTRWSGQLQERIV